MLSLVVGQTLLAVYAVLLGVGGVIGYRKAASRASLIAGSVSALVALMALALTFAQPRPGITLGLVLAVCLTIQFAYRFAIKTRKFMPSGLLAVLSTLVAAILAGVLASSG